MNKTSWRMCLLWTRPHALNCDGAWLAILAAQLPTQQRYAALQSRHDRVPKSSQLTPNTG